MNPTWEYAVDYVLSHTGSPATNFSLHMQGKFHDELNKAGLEGWECFQIIPGTNGYIIFYKRRKP